MDLPEAAHRASGQVSFDLPVAVLGEEVGALRRDVRAVHKQVARHLDPRRVREDVPLQAPSAVRPEEVYHHRPRVAVGAPGWRLDDEIIERFDVASVQFSPAPRYNIAPSQTVAAIVQQGGRDGGLFAFAGLWEEWRSPDGEPLRTCTIVTVEPNELLATLHHRMAAILKPGHESLWLDPATSYAPALLQLLRPYPDDDFECYPVSRSVNSPAHDEASYIEPLR